MGKMIKHTGITATISAILGVLLLWSAFYLYWLFSDVCYDLSIPYWILDILYIIFGIVFICIGVILAHTRHLLTGITIVIWGSGIIAYIINWYCLYL